MTRDELIAALEKATGPSRELDVALFAHVLPIPPGSRIDIGDDMVGYWPPNAPYVSAETAPRYTASIDAALTLVPEGARVRELGQWWDVSAPGGWFCNVMRWKYDEDRHIVECAYTFGIIGPRDDKMPLTAPTAAIALCIAALKARQP